MDLSPVAVLASVWAVLQVYGWHLVGLAAAGYLAWLYLKYDGRNFSFLSL